jgi:subtilase family serine protease
MEGNLRSNIWKSVNFPRAVAMSWRALAVGTVVSSTSWAGSVPPEAAVEDGVLFQPASSTQRAADAGVRTHTNIEVIKPKLGLANHPNTVTGSYVGSPPISGYAIETPASLECVYKFTAQLDGCNPNQVTAEAAGGTKIIAIVDAYDYVDAKTDLATYSTQFGLPAPSATYFEKVYATGTKPASGSGTGWDIEAALDIEMAHSAAPKAKVILVEAASPNNSDMYFAVGVAAGLVAAAGDGEVSMSWGEGEYSGETGDDSTFAGYAHVVFYASSGDAAGTEYPCMSPNVVCVGGTAHSRNASTLAIEKQDTWINAGGGASPYEAAPSYQSALGSTVRLAPDVSAIADPYNGVWVYNCTYEGACYWYQVGGTSVASPLTASLDNHAGHFAANSVAYLTALYGADGTGHTDITNGFCGVYYGLLAGKGWDNCTGWGSPLK